MTIAPPAILCDDAILQQLRISECHYILMGFLMFAKIMKAGDQIDEIGWAQWVGQCVIKWIFEKVYGIELIWNQLKHEVKKYISCTN